MLQNSLRTIKAACVSACKHLPKKRLAAFAAMFLFCAVATFAQSAGAGGFQKAIAEVSCYQVPVGNLDEGHRRSDCAGGRFQRLF